VLNDLLGPHRSGQGAWRQSLAKGSRGRAHVYAGVAYVTRHCGGHHIAKRPWYPAGCIQPAGWRRRRGQVSATTVRS
jgi:hypothetical protein